NDENPDPLKAPHVVNNSWGYAGGNDPVIEADILALVSAGIFIEVSSGNEGPGCQTLRSPADYENTFTTGASISGGLLAGFSSRGPSQLYPAITKPEVVAPGQNIRSSVPGGGYEGGWSGTSMAGPHTVGLVALIWSANPNLIGDLDTTRQLIQDTAVFSDVNECAGESRGIPNNVYGWGEIDCYAVVQEVYPPESAGMLMLSRAAYNCSDTISIVVKDSDIAGTGTLDVLATSTTETGTPETVVLSEDDAGVFRGTITTATGSPTPDGILQITENDQITIEYIDVDHGGTGPLTITRTAVVDCTAPVASNIIIDTLTSISAEISWDTNENSTTGILFGETTPLGDKIVMGRYNIEHSVVLGGLLECTDYLYAIEVMDEAGNMFIDDNAGQYYTFKTWRNIRAMDEPLNSDPEWETQGNWEFGVPQGNDGDPTSGTTGSNVYGYNLAGAYENNMPKYSLISPSYDLTTATRTTIGYSLWVGVGAYPDDQLGWDVSLDGGTTWIPLFDNSYFSGSMQMDFWIPIEVPLGDLIDGQADVSFRWTMGPTDDSEVFGGWNIDDIWMSYDTDCDLPTPTPAPTATPTFPLGVRIDVPEMAHPGEMFHVTGYLDNPDPVLSSVPVFFILDVYGEMWFWPGWKHFSPPDFVDIDYRIMDIPTGSSEVIVLAEFAWPDTGSGNISGLFFYGAMLNQQMSGLLGEMAAEQWGYSPG
ncbi:S8 family serine peptidase, partial [bacterium]|nr:S8 family serine peptidase [bacterium]